jgi:hypothetical protein
MPEKATVTFSRLPEKQTGRIDVDHRSGPEIESR